MTTTRRVQLEPAFLLHHREWSDSSRILDFLTRHHGRITLFARGARRPKSPLRSLLQPFTPLLVSFSLRGDAGQLTAAEPGSRVDALPPARLMSGFYVNELVMRLLQGDDTHPEVFDAYAEAIDALRGEAPEQAALRRFELGLLEHLGYGVDLGRDVDSGEPLVADRYYHFQPGMGFRGVREAEPGEEAYRGADLLALEADRLDTAQSLRAAKRLLRAALEHSLEGRGLKSRDVMLALRRQETDK